MAKRELEYAVSHICIHRWWRFED